ncbi:MAG: DUF2634 domain-containing protein [Bacteroidota bacterium]
MADFFKDIKLSLRSFDVQVSDRDYVDLESTAGGDLSTVSGRSNLAQAIINRLLTRKGELTKLGHPNYGSRLHLLVGELNNIRLQGLAEIYIREALAVEKRIEQIISVSFAPPVRGADRDMLKVQIRVKPIGDEKELTIALPVAI